MIDLLKEHNCVGVNLQKGPHYSGNFWWSKSSHIINLKKKLVINILTQNSGYFKKHDCKYASLYLSNVDHYKTNYPQEKYISKKIIFILSHFKISRVAQTKVGYIMI